MRDACRGVRASLKPSSAEYKLAGREARHETPRPPAVGPSSPNSGGEDGGEDLAAGDGGYELCVEDGVLQALAGMADGDARVALNALEMAICYAAGPPEPRAAPCDTPPCVPSRKRPRPDGCTASDRAAGPLAASADDGGTGESDSSEEASLPISANGRGGGLGGVAVNPGQAGPAGGVSLPAGMGGCANRVRRVLVRLEHVRRALQRTHLVYDAAGDEHFNLISALHKSIRGSDPQATVRDSPGLRLRASSFVKCRSLLGATQTYLPCVDFGRCTGWLGCWKEGRIPSTLGGGLCERQARMWVWLTQRRCRRQVFSVTRRTSPSLHL